MACIGRAEALLARHWWRPRPSLLSRLLWPLAALYRVLWALRGRAPGQRAPVPVVVVGNIIAGGAGKTPTVIALVQALQAAGWRPGVISRGHGRAHVADVRSVSGDDSAAEVGDEPLLIRRRTGVPVWVARRRVAAALALCRTHPEVDVLVADDGLQHRALARDVEVVVFDERGIGNGLLLPAGPLREPMPRRWPAGRLVVYNAPAPSVEVPGVLAERSLGRVQPLAAWAARTGEGSIELQALRGRRLVAAAGMAAPERFFTMLEAAGLSIERLPLADHYPYAQLPWRADTPDVIVTEKDAVKLASKGGGTTRIWVAGLDLRLPASLVGSILQRLGPRRTS